MKISRDLVYEVWKNSIENKTGLTLITLKEFIEHYEKEISDYYEIGPWSKLDENDSDVLILCLVDYQPQTKRKRISKSAGKIRRDKFKHRHTYNNPLNRIHGFVALEECSTVNVGERNVVSIAVVGSSIFSPLRGIGSDLMRYTEAYANQIGYTDIVLEVSNEYSHKGHEDDFEKETYENEPYEGSGESDSESESESSDEEEYDSSDEEELDEEDFLEELKDILAHEFWRKIMRRVNDRIFYNLDEDYIWPLIDRYFNCFCSPTRPFREKIIISEEPEENEYGGFWYREGSKQSANLKKFYEYHGYREDSKVHTDWRCFTRSPYPSMIKNLYN